jgi:uncharacterized membrane protein YGL010W
MKSMQDWFDAYGESHRNPTNKIIHWICVPLIFFTILGILSFAPLGFLAKWLSAGLAPFAHAGTLLVLLGLAFFARLSVPIAVGMLLVSGAMLWLVQMVHTALGPSAWIVFVSIFVMSWIGQFIGHKIEAAKPSFFDDLKFLLIGPAWLLHFIYRKLGLAY